MLLKVLFVLSITLEVVFVPLYLKAIWPERSRKSLILKMICSSLFVMTGIFAALIAGNRSSFAVLILIGLVMGWIGDFFMHDKEKPGYFLIGLVSFLGGHLLYIIAYCIVLKQVFPETRLFDPVETIVFVLAFCVAIAAVLLRKMDLGRAALPVGIYTAVLLLMLIKASSLGIRLVMQSGGQALFICAILMLGALQFLISDALLAITLFAGEDENYPMKIANIVTYFAAQNLLASTILFFT